MKAEKKEGRCGGLALADPELDGFRIAALAKMHVARAGLSRLASRVCESTSAL